MTDRWLRKLATPSGGHLGVEHGAEGGAALPLCATDRQQALQQPRVVPRRPPQRVDVGSASERARLTQLPQLLEERRRRCPCLGLLGLARSKARSPQSS